MVRRKGFTDRKTQRKEGEIFEDEYLLLFNFQGLFGPHRRHGGVAQLGEHLPCKQGVMGSNPIISTNLA